MNPSLRKKLMACMLTLTLVLTMSTPVFAAKTSDSMSKPSVLKTSNVKKGAGNANAEAKQLAPAADTINKASSTVRPNTKSNRFKTVAPKKNSETAGTLAAKLPYANDRIIVKFKQDYSIKSLGSNVSKLKLATKKKLGNSGAQLMTIGSGTSVQDAIRVLKQTKAVEYVEPDYAITPSSITVNDPLYGHQWGLKNIGQEDYYEVPGTPGIDIDVEKAWDTTLGNEDLVVAVIDTGIDYNHPDLVNNMWTNTAELEGAAGVDDDNNGYIDDIHGYDFWNDTGDVFNSFDGDEHGTHVAGTIAATANTTGVIGVAPNVKIMSLKFIGPEIGYTSDAISAIEYAKAHNIKIANNSWGGADYSQALHDTIQNSGMLFVASAGNDMLNADSNPEYPAAYDCENILSVAAVDNNGYLAWFSNYGSTSVDIAAPGVSILSTYPGGGLKPEGGAGLLVNANSPTNGLSYQSVVQGFGLQEFASPVVQRDIMVKALNSMGITPQDPILLVDDDDSENGALDCLSVYQNALTGYNFTTYTVPAGSPGPTPINFISYKAVIWFTGESSGGAYDPLQIADINSLTSYLDIGYQPASGSPAQGNAKLFLSGPDILYENEDSPFVTDYLHTDVVYDGDERNVLIGKSGTTYAGTNYTLDGQFSDWNDELAPADGNAVVTLAWPETTISHYAYSDGTSMAAPHVSGSAALLLSAHEEYSPNQIKGILMKTRTPLDSLNGLVASGGMVNIGRAINFNPDDDIPGVPLNGIVTGTLHQDTDLDDVFRVHLSKGERISIGFEFSSDNDFDLYLYGPLAKTVRSSEGIVAYSEDVGTSAENINFVAPVEGEYYIDCYGYAGSGEYTLNVIPGATVGLYQNDAPDISYKGNWQTITEQTASGGTFAGINSKGAAKMFINGSGFVYYADKNSSQGIARVIIDDKNYLVDLYSKTRTFGKAFEKLDLEPGYHVVTIEWTGMASRLAKKTATSINIDALEVVLDITPPAAPTGLMGSSTPIGHPSLTWTANTDADLDHYVVCRGSGVNPPSFDTFFDVPKNVTSFIDNEVVPTPVQPYTYHVVAVDKAKNKSMPSNNVVYPIDTTPPAAPVILDGYVDANNHAAFDWQMSPEPDVKGYIIQRGQGSAPTSWTTITPSPINPFTGPALTHPFFVDQGITFSASSVYSYQIKAVDEAGNVSPPSPIRTLSYRPAAPVGLTATLTDENVHLAWAQPGTPPNGISGYNVYRSTTSGSGYTKLNTSLLQTRVYDDTSVPAGTYYYVVTIVGLNGQESVYSNEVQITLAPSGIITRYEDSNSKITYTGTWTNHSNASHSQSTVKYSKITGDSAQFTFNGSGIRLIAYKSPSYGIADIFIDGSLVTTVDLYSSAPSFQQLVYENLSLSPIDHTIEIVVKGQKNSSSIGNYVNVDAFEVIQPPPSTKITLQDTNSTISYTGSWAALSNSSHSGGSIKFSKTTGDYSLLTFTGTGISLKAYKSPNYGFADIFIDGSLVQTVDLYSSTPSFQQLTYENLNLSPTAHTIKVVVKGQKNSSSGDYYVSIDSFEVTPLTSNVTIQDNNPNLSYNGTWTVLTNTSHSGGTVKYSKTTGDFAQFSFIGSGIRLIAYKSPNYGIADIFIDGSLVQSVDLYSSTSSFQQLAYDNLSLSPAAHTIKIIVKGQKNSSSNGYFVNIDALEVTP